MEVQTIDRVLDEFYKFSLEERELLMDILQKRIIEEKRKNILKKYKTTLKNYKTGKVKKGSVVDLLGGDQ